MEPIYRQMKLQIMGAPASGLERVKGIEPSYAAWEAAVLPLNYTRNYTRKRGRTGWAMVNFYPGQEGFARFDPTGSTWSRPVMEARPQKDKIRIEFETKPNRGVNG
jgi:hypothetical protein